MTAGRTLADIVKGNPDTGRGSHRKARGRKRRSHRGPQVQSRLRNLRRRKQLEERCTCDSSFAALSSLKPVTTRPVLAVFPGLPDHDELLRCRELTEPGVRLLGPCWSDHSIRPRE